MTSWKLHPLVIVVYFPSYIFPLKFACLGDFPIFTYIFPLFWYTSSRISHESPMKTSFFRGFPASHDDTGGWPCEALGNLQQKNDACHGEKHRNIWKPWKKTLFYGGFWNLLGNSTRWFLGIKTRVPELTFHFLSVCARYHYAKRWRYLTIEFQHIKSTASFTYGSNIALAP